MKQPLYLGIDVGTQGVRAILMDATGAPAAQSQDPFDAGVAVAGLPVGWFEQKPDVWLKSLEHCLSALLSDASLAARVEAISVTSTSGTLVPVDASGNALCPAVMYNDARSEAEAKEAQSAGAALAGALGYKFKSSFALPKILWIKRHQPKIYERAACLVSPTDFIVGRLCGRCTVSDYTNMLKTGYDLLSDGWPAFLGTLGLDADKLPSVVKSGSVIGPVRADVARQYGLDSAAVVCAGATDGCASQISTGAVAPGQWCTTIGTTLVIKGVSEKLVLDPEGRIYSHRHPEGYWLPGGASNTGSTCLDHRFAGEIESLGGRALDVSPTDLLVYPLLKKGERFPFVCPQAEGFAVGADTGDRARLFAAHLEGVAYVERLSFEMLEGLGLQVGESIYTSGGGTKSAAWLQIRADVLDRRILKPALPLGAVGAAILAASLTGFSSLSQAASKMVRIESETTPRRAHTAAYADRYARFTAELKQRGYL